MKNKSILWSMQTAIMVAFLSLVFTSCSGDENENQTNWNQKEIIKNLMNHKWTGSFTDYDVYSYGAATYTETYTVYFTSEHEGVMHIIIVDRDSSLGTNRREEHIDFFYTVDGNKVRLSGGSNFVFVYYGNYMMEGDDLFTSNEMTSSDYNYLQEHKSGYHGKDGEITGDFSFETSLINTKEFGQDAMGWYQYMIDYIVGTTEDTYRKGVSMIRVTVWSSNATYSSLKTSDYGKKHSETFYLSLTNLSFRDRLLMLSKDRSFILNYEVEYFNSKDNSWYTYRSGTVSFSM